MPECCACYRVERTDEFGYLLRPTRSHQMLKPEQCRTKSSLRDEWRSQPTSVLAHPQYPDQQQLGSPVQGEIHTKKYSVIPVRLRIRERCWMIDCGLQGIGEVGHLLVTNSNRWRPSSPKDTSLNAASTTSDTDGIVFNPHTRCRR